MIRANFGAKISPDLFGSNEKIFEKKRGTRELMKECARAHVRVCMYECVFVITLIQRLRFAGISINCRRFVPLEKQIAKISDKSSRYSTDKTGHTVGVLSAGSGNVARELKANTVISSRK